MIVYIKNIEIFVLLFLQWKMEKAKPIQVQKLLNGQTQQHMSKMKNQIRMLQMKKENMKA